MDDQKNRPSDSKAPVVAPDTASDTEDTGLFEEASTAIQPGVAQTARELTAQPATVRSFLVYLSGIELGRNIPLEKDKMVVGRGSECDLVLQDESVSRVHATIHRLDDETILVEDHGSTNGTFVNGEPVLRAVAANGDRLVFGKSSVFRYSLLDQVDQEFQAQMHSSYVRDPLTSVYNKRFLVDSLVSGLRYAQRHATPLSFLMFDLDHFKEVNDIHGHPTGDKVLVEVSRIAQSIIRGDDVLARYGGEEFAVVAPITSSEGINKLAERLRTSISAAHFTSNTRVDMSVAITISIGCATLLPGTKADADQLIQESDRNLYLAKQGGRDRVVFSILS